MSEELIQKIVDLLPFVESACSAVVAFCLIVGVCVVGMVFYVIYKDDRKNYVERKKKIVDEIKNEVYNELQRSKDNP